MAKARLMAKVRAHGIIGQVADWIEAWLTERKQRVVLNGSCSSWRSVFSGVPQGSILGPTLFVIFINDIDLALDLTDLFLSKFADDTKAARVVDTDAEAARLQNDLDGFAQWAREWQMLFNVDKCKVIHVGRTNPRRNYTMEGKQLIKVEEEKDLGVMVHQSLKPGAQVAKAVKKANEVLGQLIRAFTYRDKYIFIQLYKVYVRCHLEYAIQCCSPYLEQDIQAIEDVQRRAIRQVSGITESYEEKLEKVGLTTLQDRRVRGDLIQTFKIMHQVDDIPVDTFFQVAGANHDHATRQAVTVTQEGGTSNMNLAMPRANLEV
jgi:ribonuclease P/MRP protein subunit RPP40